MAKKWWNSQERLTRKQFSKLSEEEKYQFVPPAKMFLKNELDGDEDDVRWDADEQIRELKSNLWTAIDEAKSEANTFSEMHDDEAQTVNAAMLLSANEALFEILREVKKLNAGK
jgi:hypothetical protein